jgi:SAM-dependent methyltransferase
MKIGTVPENLLERVASAAGLVPHAVLETLPAILLARTIMVGTKLGVFELLKDGALPAPEVATRLKTDAYATEKLLNALVGTGYVRLEDGRYGLGANARRWLLAESPNSLRDLIIQWDVLEWNWVGRCEEFVRSGEPVRIHEGMNEEQWKLYQRGMRSASALAAPEVAKLTPVPKGARDMLDIGGSHGYNSVALCRRHPTLRAVVMDLPEAVEQAAPILAQENMGDRVVHRAGDVLKEDLGTEAFDLIFASNVLHHFDERTNRELTQRIARALRPGGYFVISDFIRPVPGKGQVGSLLDLFFALTSESGTWSFEEMADWQRSAGLQPRKPIRRQLTPGAGLQAAMKPLA